MAAMIKLGALDSLPQTSASDVKNIGWRGVMKAVDRAGTIVVTNHKEPEAVVISVALYEALRAVADSAQAGKLSVLDELRTEFDQRLAVLSAPDAGKRLRAVMKKRAKLDGKVKAGKSF